MKKYTTIEVVKKIMEDKSLRFVTEIDGKQKTAFYNQNGGISSDGKSTLVLGGKMLNAVWEEEQKPVSFLKAINSNKRIKHKDFKEFKPVQEAIFELLDYSQNDIVRLLNGEWNIERSKV